MNWSWSMNKQVISQTFPQSYEIKYQNSKTYNAQNPFNSVVLLSQHIHDAICKFLYSLIKVFMVKIVKIYADMICNIQCDQ